ncbi:Translation initiation factor eIF-2B subunit gamma [Sorochytrium milnesiophthora]
MSLYPIPGAASTAKSAPTQTEFQAVVLAGYGNQLYPLTEKENVPKALLPVADKPMISHVLAWLESAGIQNVIVLGQKGAQDELNTYFSRVYEGRRPEVVCHEDGLENAEALRRLRDKIKHDFLVIACDSITTLPAHHMLDLFRIQSPNVAAAALFYDRSMECCAAVPTSESATEITAYGKYPHYDDITATTSATVGSDDNGSSTQPLQLLYTTDESDLSSGELSLRMSMLRKFPAVNVSTALHDAHLYVFRRWVIDLIAAKSDIMNIRNDLLPLLLKCQYAPKLPQCQPVLEAMAGVHHKTMKPSLSASSGSEMVPTPMPSPLGSQFSLYQPLVANESPMRVVLHIARTGVAIRANNVAAYSEISRYLARSAEQRIAASAELHARSQVGPDSMVGEGSRVGERTSVKKSVIGAHVTVGKNVRITNSVLMDHIVIGDEIKLDGVVVCNGATIHDKSQLKDCIVGGGFTIERETTAKGEKFMHARDLSTEEAE